ncbi:hypothetical protein AV656_07360 [Bhargavaea cecembensis]|uniref:Uncharacterized protein n=1 Tax=Bhargavaea cecembensis TaxID=394098 RepID=A0A161SLU6_9BACL|nr:hypothetical protein [Bhargavaea cecembensis]KZE38713.1 hypothetical protein AV656_07360 [Bhargavaea cecembensis]
MKQKRFRKLPLSAAALGIIFGVAIPASAADGSDTELDELKLNELNEVHELGIIGQEDEMFSESYNMLAIKHDHQPESSLDKADQNVNKKESVMPASFYSDLQQGKVQGAAVQIGSDLSELKARAGEPEAEFDFEGGIRHVYGKYHYGVPYVADEQEEKPVTTVTYHFKEKPTVEEVRQYMGSAEVEEGMDFDYLWYSKDDYELFFELPAGAEKVDNVTVKWNYS